MLSVNMLSIIILSFVILSIVMLNVVASVERLLETLGLQTYKLRPHYKRYSDKLMLIFNV
jgi:hypothetical protein